MLRRIAMLMLIPYSCLLANDLFTSAIRSLIEEFLDDNDEEEELISSTAHVLELDNITFDYTAITGVLPQYAKKKKVGKLSFTAYLKDSEHPKRPVTFIFNGGPGGSSLAMHIGSIGPKRLLLPEEGQPLLPPYQMIENPETLLVESDLVFIDPMSTGYSQADKEWYKYQCYGVEGDLQSFTEFVRVFCTHFKKWNHPKYLMGASYGTTRACGLAERLAWEGLHLNGIILLSCAIDFSTQVSERDLSLSDALLIPSLAATAWYHGRIMQDKTLEEVVEHARRFVSEQYAPVMFQPSRLNNSEFRDFNKTLSDLIGLPLDTVRRYNSRIDETIYTQEFLAPERQVIGGMDSRYTGDITTLRGEFREDPSYRDIAPAFYPAYMDYLQNDLEIVIQSMPYKDFSAEAFRYWNWNTYDSPGIPNFLQRLRRTLVINPAMKVFVGSGYYDLRTPFAATEYSIDHLDLPSSYRKNFQIEYYNAGHGFVFDLNSLAKLKKDLTTFYEAK